MRTVCETILLMGVLPFVGSAAIDISPGRQLFVDDFLVEATTKVTMGTFELGSWGFWISNMTNKTNNNNK